MSRPRLPRVGVDRVRELLGRYVNECSWFWAENTDKNQCAKLCRHLEAIEQSFGLDRESALDEVASMAQGRQVGGPATVYVSGRGGSGSHWLAEMLDDLGPFANAGEVSFPTRLTREIAAWPFEDQGLLVDCVTLLHAWAGKPFAVASMPEVVRPNVAQLHLVNCNGDTNLLKVKQWEPGCLFIHLIRDPRDQVMAFTYRKPSAHANYPIEPLEDFLRFMLIFNRLSLSRVISAPAEPDLVCRYEDLLQDPRPDLSRIATRLGLDVPDRVIDEVAIRHSAEGRRQGKAPMGNLSRRPTRSWQETATAQERLLMHAGLAEVLDTLGYPPDDCAGTPLEFRVLAADVPVSLPADVVLGEIHIRRAPEDTWRRDGHAAGSFLLSAGTMVRLRAPGGWTTGLEGLSELLPAGALASLCLAGNSDADDGLVRTMAGWSGLIELDLARTRVTEAALESIAQLSGLRHLSVVGTAISADAVQWLHGALPGCTISHSPLITDQIRGRRLFDEELITEPPQ